SVGSVRLEGLYLHFGHRVYRGTVTEPPADTEIGCTVQKQFVLLGSPAAHREPGWAAIVERPVKARVVAGNPSHRKLCQDQRRPAIQRHVLHLLGVDDLTGGSRVGLE